MGLVIPEQPAYKSHRRAVLIIGVLLGLCRIDSIKCGKACPTFRLSSKRSVSLGAIGAASVRAEPAGGLWYKTLHWGGPAMQQRTVGV